MAELVLGIAGVVLAWKGIMDFGELILKLTDNDTRRREGLSLRLEVSQYMLKDWGDYWGVDKDDGGFHRFEPARKELIFKIIFRLHESRLKALKVLRKRYNLPIKDDEDDGTGAANRLSRMVDRVKGSSKTLKDKGVWLAHDQSEIIDLVNETMELHENLQYLTYGSHKFIRDTASEIQAPVVIDVGMENMMDHKDVPPSPRSAVALVPPISPEPTLDEQTLASYATKSIASTSKAGRIQYHIDRAFHFYGDDRIIEAVCTWWNDDEPGVLVIEAPDDGDDETSVLTCVVVYYVASCQRLIYSFSPDSRENADVQFVEMLRTLILSMLTMGGSQQFNELPLPSDMLIMENTELNVATIKQLIGLFHQVLNALVTGQDRRVLLVIDGLERVGAGNLSSLVRSFVDGLRPSCISNEASHLKATVKILLGFRGHALVLYGSVGDQDLVDLTDCPTQTTNIMHELAVGMHKRN
ncbi:Uu.00g122250.m01.CDS01 [Anthostomella pinea]|uniref:Uu.00g122250.m01.CDS01 n=1 Tax=Anthostomella pinea TaxID=933095 RepID=A0AAI8YHE6_9PEZI|nr:Uu.00g122250.m01.CDS01 [Anthostomella pinea]